MTITRVGTNQKYAEGWEAAFGGNKAKRSTAKAAAKAKKKPAKAAKKKKAKS